MAIGDEMHALVRELFPIPRSLTGEGVRTTLKILQQTAPQLALREIASGTPCFDWIVPDEWIVRGAYVDDPEGNRIADFRWNNLHLVGYSCPVDTELELAELQKHLHSAPELPDAIPYVTSYYHRTWGFCLSERVRRSLRPGRYRVRVDSEFRLGTMSYGEILIPGRHDSEIFLSTYICHPSMANNELSGPVVAAFLGKWLGALPSRRHSYRIIFVPETIGAIAYLSLHLRELKKRVVAGYVITCIGDDRTYSYLSSRAGDTLADRAARHVLGKQHPGYRSYTYLDRGSDERQYCSPGIDLPIGSVMRSKYGTYPEYHTSFDNLDLVTPSGLEGGYTALRAILEAIELNLVPRALVLGEPQLGRRGLYPELGTAATRGRVRNLMNLLAYADGGRDLLEIADLIDVPIFQLRSLCDQLAGHGLLSLSEPERFPSE